MFKRIRDRVATDIADRWDVAKSGPLWRQAAIVLTLAWGAGAIASATVAVGAS